MRTSLVKVLLIKLLDVGNLITDLPEYNLYRGQMILQELQKQALQLPTIERWELVQTLLESLKQETPSKLKRGNLSRLRGIAQNSISKPNSKDDYINHLVEKYQ